jgi:hypothetical protein
MAEQGDIIYQRRTWRGGGPLLLIMAAPAWAIAGRLATNAFSQAAILWHLRPFMGGPFDPVQVDRHVERVIKRLAASRATPATCSTAVYSYAFFAEAGALMSYGARDARRRDRH